MPTRLKIALALAPLALAACGTQEIDPNNVIVASSQAGPDVGGLTVFFPPTDETYQASQARAAATANPTVYHVVLDGKLLVFDPGDGHLTPFTPSEGGAASLGYLPAGPHHFAIAAPSAAPIFEADGQLTGGETTNLFLFGPLNGLQGKFLRMPVPATGNQYVTAINLIRSGQTIEVVSCTDASTCTPISPALALGDVFQAELPAVTSSTSSDYSLSLTQTGAGVGYRMVPSAAVPAPPVQVMYEAFEVGAPSYPPALEYLGAPVFMTDQGQSLSSL